MQEIIIGGVVTVAIAALLKKYPREKLLKLITPVINGFAITIDALLLKWLPKKAAHKVEEGLLCTITFLMRNAADIFEKKILENNEKKKQD